MENIQSAMGKTIEVYKKNQRNKNRGKKKPQLKKEQAWAINESYYTFHVKNRWPLFQNEIDNFYVVAPQSEQFLKQKLFYQSDLF